jgi:hypothetical protein
MAGSGQGIAGGFRNIAIFPEHLVCLTSDIEGGMQDGV